MTVFSDFQCPYCKRAMEILNDEMQANPSGVRLIFRNFPLPMHSWARPAAEMAACAYRQSNDAFWHVHDWLFLHQAEITADNLAEKVDRIVAERSDIDETVYASCVAEHQSSDQVDKDMSFAKDHRLRGTPTVFVNGERLDYVGNRNEIRALIEHYRRSSSEMSR